MKRSRNVRLVLMGTAALAVAACDGKDNTLKIPTKTYESVGECEKIEGEGKCAIPEAVLMTKENRPTFSDKVSCEREFGEQYCERTPHAAGGHYFYQPMFIPGSTGYYPAGSGLTGYYGGSPNTAFTESSMRSASVAVPARTVTIARGGFGARGAAVSVAS